MHNNNFKFLQANRKIRAAYFFKEQQLLLTASDEIVLIWDINEKAIKKRFWFPVDYEMTSQLKKCLIEAHGIPEKELDNTLDLRRILAARMFLNRIKKEIKT